VITVIRLGQLDFSSGEVIAEYAMIHGAFKNFLITGEMGGIMVYSAIAASDGN
jgi:hypothetical protein